MKKVINGGERSTTQSKIKPVRNINKNLQNFFLHINWESMHMSTRILLDERKITSHKEIAKIN